MAQLSPITIGITVAVVALVGGGAVVLHHSESETNKVALSSEPKPVTVVEAKTASYRASRMYVGRLDPWISASVGPQFVSAYVDTVLVRPGDVVKRGRVLATLDCRNASATEQAIEMQARALDAQQAALAHQSTRVTSMLDGGFVSPNEAEQTSAESAAKQAQLLAERAKMIGSSLEVSDCVLRAPFDGEIATRTVDPGAFVRPGTAIVSVVDRDLVRMTADVPENDFDVVTPGKKASVLIYATSKELQGSISRRAPAADPGTRTVHVEVDIPDPKREIPVGTTGELHIDAGEPVPAVRIPLSAATIRDTKATIFVVDGTTAHAKTFTSLGESQGAIYAAPADVPPGSRVVTEGRAVLRDGDAVLAALEPEAAAGAKP
ncbi:MAG: efflux RND transporter periplasmic adaptor subunit [Polyangiaceae bacterium]